jgi:hypothetical protein
MKGKRYTTEKKIRILRQADRGEKSVAKICREQNSVVDKAVCDEVLAVLRLGFAEGRAAGTNRLTTA